MRCQKSWSGIGLGQRGWEREKNRSQRAVPSLETGKRSGKRSGKRKGKGEARANRGLRRRLRLFHSFKSLEIERAQNGQLSPRPVWWRGSQSNLSSTPAPVRRLSPPKHRGPVPFYPRPVPCGKGSSEKGLECRTAAQAES